MCPLSDIDMLSLKEVMNARVVDILDALKSAWAAAYSG
jgi:hypothetical protein